MPRVAFLVMFILLCRCTCEPPRAQPITGQENRDLRLQKGSTTLSGGRLSWTTRSGTLARPDATCILSVFRLGGKTGFWRGVCGFLLGGGRGGGAVFRIRRG